MKQEKKNNKNTLSINDYSLCLFIVFFSCFIHYLIIYDQTDLLIGYKMVSPDRIRLINRFQWCFWNGVNRINRSQSGPISFFYKGTWDDTLLPIMFDRSRFHFSNFQKVHYWHNQNRQKNDWRLRIDVSVRGTDATNGKRGEMYKRTWNTAPTVGRPLNFKK